MNYFDKKKEKYFQAIRDSFYIQRVRSGPKINESFVESYIQFLPRLCDSSGNENLKDEGINLLVKLIREADLPMREVLFNAIVNTLRYHCPQTVFYYRLLGVILTEVNDEKIHEHILRILLERCCTETFLPIKVMEFINEIINNKTRYRTEIRNHPDPIIITKQTIQTMFSYYLP